MDKHLKKLLQNERDYLYTDFSSLHKTQQKLYNEINKEQNNLLNNFPANERQAKNLVDRVNTYDDKVRTWVANAMRMEKMEQHIRAIRSKLHGGINKPSKTFERIGYQENSARIMLEKRNEQFYPKMFHELISKTSSFHGPNFTFTVGEAKIPEPVDLNLSKKTLQTRKDRLTSEFKDLHNESNKWKNKLNGLTQEVIKNSIDLENPDYRREFKRALKSHHSIEHVAAPIVNSIDSLHSSMLNYADSLIRLHKKEGELFETRKQINDKEQYVNGSKTLKKLGYERGQALADLKAVGKDYYTPKLLSAIDYTRSLGAEVLRTVDVHKIVETDKKVQQVSQLKAKGSFADRTKRAKKMAGDFQQNRPTTSNHEKSR
ncbi:hypothetical protein [Enterococcus mundtii]|uniref:Uncharacterized protein n=1 Tax=Enterococcus mundtii TaxID=53346 RepID=A0A2S7RS23_ENTMU|nr:hypothetical protein [Enterococcus mundtii]MDA9462274.1 hypothetical protein [Enterococcus mundtii 3F]PQF22384.1 hypothetical protein CUS89_10700 [Enterococcus mundtii]